MAFNFDVLSVNTAKLNGSDILSGTREISQMVADNKIILDSTHFTGTDDVNTVTNIDGDVVLGDIIFKITITDDLTDVDYFKFVTVNGQFPSFVSAEGKVYTFMRQTVNINAFDVVDLDVYNITKIEFQTKVGAAMIDSGSFSTFPYSYVTPLTNVHWSIVEPTATIDFDNAFTELQTVTLEGNVLQTSTSLIKGDVISIDKEVFTYVNYVDNNGIHLYSVADINDGVTSKELEYRDIQKINFVQDYRDGTYDFGLRSALIANEVGSVIYGQIDDEIIIDANEGGKFIVGNMYTIGGFDDTDATDKFEIHTSNDGVDWTKIYENTVIRQSNTRHVMSGEGRFVKIVFKSVTNGWGRIQTNIVNNKFWNLSIVHPESVLYKMNVSLEIDGIVCKPDYIEYFDDMTTNKLHFEKTGVDNYVLEIKSNSIDSLELDLWYEIKGFI